MCAGLPTVHEIVIGRNRNRDADWDVHNIVEMQAQMSVSRKSIGGKHRPQQKEKMWLSKLYSALSEHGSVRFTHRQRKTITVYRFIRR